MVRLMTIFNTELHRVKQTVPLPVAIEAMTGSLLPSAMRRVIRYPICIQLLCDNTTVFKY